MQLFVLKRPARQPLKSDYHFALRQLGNLHAFASSMGHAPYRSGRP
jgi:hypothetical protein